MIQLRDYQLDIANRGVEILRQHKILYLALAVRVGKTLTSLHIAHLYEAKNVLFITKKKVIEDIEAQAKSLNPCYVLFTTNYENLHKVSTGGQQNYDIIICDECHTNGAFPVPSKRTKQIKKLAAGLPIIMLSGSPSPESWSQLYHQMFMSSFSPWSQYKTFYKWAQDYVTIKKKYIYNRAINDYSDANKEKIDADTKHLFISFTQEEAGFTEFVEEEVIYVRMADRTYHLADKLRKEKVLKSKDDVILGDTAVKLMQKLHQLYSGTCITEAGVSILLDYNKANYIWKKFSLIKFAVFYKFKAEYEIMKEVFGKYITQSIEDFNAQPELIYASQIQSGREGLNLSEADALVFYNIDFSHVSYIQARARLQTKDRTTPAKVYWIFSEGGIESRIYAAVQAKSDYQLSHFKKDYLSKIAGSVPKSVSKRS
jgi:hypothetical protein